MAWTVHALTPMVTGSRTAALVLAFFLSAGVAGAREATAPVVAPNQSSFVERFQAPVLDPRWRVSHGWHSGEWFSTIWDREQVELVQQGARFSLAPAPAGAEKPYVSGEIATNAEYLYGYFEARLRVPRGNGLVASFFSFTRPDGPASQNEIDIEFTGYDTRRVELVYHVGEAAVLHVVQLPFDAAADFHTYAFEWRPNRIRWFIDNRLVFTSRGGRVNDLNRPQRVFASLWNSERMPRWLGRIDPAEAPWRMNVACIAHAPAYRRQSLCID